MIFTGYLDDEDVVALLNLASVLVLPSLMEGFGLPAVEAAACGCPVIATKASPLRSAAGGRRNLHRAEGEEIAGALERVLSSKELAHAHAASAAWLPRSGSHGRAAARQMMHVIHKVAAA